MPFPQVCLLALSVLLVPAAAVGPRDVEAYNAALATAVPGWATTNSPIHVVDQFTGFDPVEDHVDGIHPNARGDSKMARRWADALLTPGVLSPRLVRPLRTVAQAPGSAVKTRVMPLGDSITAGNYRWALWFLLVGGDPPAIANGTNLLPDQVGPYGLHLDFVGSQTFNVDYGGSEARASDSARRSFDRNHEGYSGFRTDELLGVCRSTLHDAARYYGVESLTNSTLGGELRFGRQPLPDIVLLHIGTNDLNQKSQRSVASMVAYVKEIVDCLRGLNPDVTVFVAQIVPLMVSTPLMVVAQLV